MDPTILKLFPLSYDEHVKHHEALLREIISTAVRSPVYAGRMDMVSSLSDIQSLPLTHYELIDECISTKGLDSVLLQKPVVDFRTSGSTGAPKRFYYNKDDVRRITSEYCFIAKVLGVHSGDRFWNLGGPLPDVSGYILQNVGEEMQLADPITTFIKDDKDLVSALRRITKEGNVDILAGAALIVFLIGKMSNDLDFLNRIVEEKACRSYHLPKPLAKLARKIYLRGIDMSEVKRVAANARIGITYAESLHPYAEDIKRAYPNIRMYDVYGSTENPIIAAQLDPTACGLSVVLENMIPEIASVQDVRRAKTDPHIKVPGILWSDWKKGTKGELIITRPGNCLPLVRYPTGDVVEVVETAREISMEQDGKQITFSLPQIKVLGRSVESLDFETGDESGNYLGIKIYSRHVTESLHASGNIKWWEIYKIKEAPAGLAVVVIPEQEISDIPHFRSEVLKMLTKEDPDIPQTFQIAYDLGRLEIIILRPGAYSAVQGEIDRRVTDGRSYGQLKPKHIYNMVNKDEFDRTLREKYSKWMP